MKMREREILYQSDCGPVLRLSNSFIFHFIFPYFVVRCICFPKSANSNLQGFNNSDLKKQENVSLFICKWYILKQCKTNQCKKWRCEKERSYINQTVDLFCDCLIPLFFILFFQSLLSDSSVFQSLQMVIFKVLTTVIWKTKRMCHFSFANGTS